MIHFHNISDVYQDGLNINVLSCLYKINRYDNGSAFKCVSLWKPISKVSKLKRTVMFVFNN